MEYERKIYRKETKRENGVPSYTSEYSRYGDSSRPRYGTDITVPTRYSTTTYKSSGPVSYTTSYSSRPSTDYVYDEPNVESTQIRKEWEDTFRRVAPRPDDWSLSDSISKRMVLVKDEDLDPYETSFPEERYRLGKPSPITSDSTGRKRFSVEYEIGDFRPEEVEVRTVGDTLKIHAKIADRGSMKREYSREVRIPHDVNPDLISARLTRSGRLTIDAPIFSTSSQTRINRRIPVLRN